MTNPFVAEIRIVPFNFAPVGWAFCNGQIMPISQNTALFSLLGTTYGGNGTSTFALPNLQDTAPIMWGQGPGLSNYVLGQTGGVETVTLAGSQMPAHSHALGCGANGDQHNPASNVPAAEASQAATPYLNGKPDSQMGGSMLEAAGGGQPHNNRQPYLVLNYIIALQGIFPPRS